MNSEVRTLIEKMKDTMIEKITDTYSNSIYILIKEYGLTFKEAVELDLNVAVKMLENLYCECEECEDDEVEEVVDTPFEEVEKIKEAMNKAYLTSNGRVERLKELR